jgi:hypothetical protein
MMHKPMPPEPLPPPLRGIETGTFTHYSITVRLVEIAERTLADNPLPEEDAAALRALTTEIPSSLIRAVREDLAPDAAKWEKYIGEQQGKNWLEVPWFFAEAYFYRRVLEATGYFQAGSGQGVDPFLKQKNGGLANAAEMIQRLARRLNLALDAGPSHQRDTLEALLQTSLWGNQADLSLWPAERGNHPDHSSLDKAGEFLLVDDTAAVTDTLLERPRRVDFLSDNAGFELVMDLFLADYLLSSGLTSTIHFHLKQHPTFVSDTLAADVGETLAWLGQEPEPDSNRAAARLVQHIQGGRLRLDDHDFWTSPLAGWEMPHDLESDLAASQLVIVKGDMHYRRCLGDLHWPFTTPFDDILRYFPTPVVCLRTYKSEVACGLTSEQVETVRRTDPDWLINGRWGLIQFRG